MGRTRSPSAAIRCSVCAQSFNRQEHLARHMRIHTQEKPYQCSVCAKHFSRPDVLTRHLASHTQNTVLPSASSTRACKQCALDRVKCSRGLPCQRCRDRRSVCRYPSRKATPRHRTPTRDMSLHSNSMCNSSSLAPGLSTEISSVAPEPLSFPSVINHTGDQIITWTSDYGGSNNLTGFDQPDLSALGVNWLSPQYQDDIDWDAILGSFTSSAQLHQDSRVSEPRVGMTTGRTTEYEGNTNHQLHDTLHHVPVRPTSVSATTPTSIENIYYVDGTGARAPFGGKSRGRNSLTGDQALGVFEHRGTNSSSPAVSQVTTYFPQTAYDELVQFVSRECQHQNLDISMEDFPSMARLHLYVRHYFEDFHPIFPFVRKTAIDQATPYEWLLLLAVAAVGSRYSQQEQEKSSADLLVTVLDAVLQLRRYGFCAEDCNDHSKATFVPGQGEHIDRCPDLPTLQAGILNVIILQKSGRKALLERALLDRHYLVQACHSLRLLSDRPPTGGLACAVNATGLEHVQQWLERETEIRIGMMIWTLDCIFLFEFNAKPLMELDDVHSLLPSRDDVWESPDPLNHHKARSPRMTLLRALESLYLEKTLPPNLSDFACAILVNAIYRHTQKIMTKDRIALHSWTPSAVAQRPVSEESAHAQPIWFSTNSSTAKWRNSACDSLDVLHWSANSKAARLSGSEHHIILQLHLARLIVLTPTENIQRLATAKISLHLSYHDSVTSNTFSARHHEILEWAIRDRCKARLSIIHCGALFWHIRRYSRNSILEPFAIYIATLVLWAFCTSMQLPEVIDAVAQDGDDDPEPLFLHLDRPIDDELVQTFVRAGHKMTAYMSQIGNVLDKGAPNKILREGASLLAKTVHIIDPLDPLDPSARSQRASAVHRETNYMWGIERSYSAFLEELVLASTDVDESVDPEPCLSQVCNT